MLPRHGWPGNNELATPHNESAALQRGPLHPTLVRGTCRVGRSLFWVTKPGNSAALPWQTAWFAYVGQSETIVNAHEFRPLKVGQQGGAKVPVQKFCRLSVMSQNNLTVLSPVPIELSPSIAPSP